MIRDTSSRAASVISNAMITASTASFRALSLVMNQAVTTAGGATVVATTFAALSVGALVIFAVVSLLPLKFLSTHIILLQVEV